MQTITITISETTLEALKFLHQDLNEMIKGNLGGDHEQVTLGVYAGWNIEKHVQEILYNKYMSLLHDGDDGDIPDWWDERMETIRRLRGAYDQERKELLSKNIDLLSLRSYNDADNV